MEWFDNVTYIFSLQAPGDKLKDHLKVAQAHLIMLHKLFSSGVGQMNLTVYQTIHVLLNGSLL